MSGDWNSTQLGQLLQLLQSQQASAGGGSNGGGTGWPFLLGVLATLACLAAGWGTLAWSESTRRRLLTCMRLKELEPDELKAALAPSDLPNWLAYPDVVRTRWMNTVSDQLWPHVGSALSKFALKDSFLEDLLNSQDFWKPPWLASSGVRVKGVVLGQAAPHIAGVKVYPHEGPWLDSEVVMDFDFEWSSRMEVSLYMKVHPLSNTRYAALRTLGAALSKATLKMSVRDLVARGTLRVILRPLLDSVPVVGAVKVSFVGPPQFNYKVSTLGVNPMFVPGMEHFVNSFIRDWAMKPFTFPDGLTLDMASLGFRTSAERPEGLLLVTVVEATHVPRMDIIGRSDPYIMLYLQDRLKMRTRVIGRTLHPVWSEDFAFIVHDVPTQALTITLYDADLFKPDEEIGKVELPLRALDLSSGVSQDIWLPITVTTTKQRDPERGTRPRRRRAPSQLQLTRTTSDDWRDAIEEATDRHGGKPQHGDKYPGAGGVGTALAQGRMPPMGLSGMFSAKPCELHLKYEYFSFSARTAQAVLAAQRSGHAHEGPLALGAEAAGHAPQLDLLLRGGVLYVHIDQAANIHTTHPLAGGFTANIRCHVSVGRHSKWTERGMSMMHRSNPIIDQTVELILDATTALDEAATVRVEIWKRHTGLPRLWMKDSFKGFVEVPLARVKAAKALRDNFMLRDTPSGTLSMDLEWMPCLEAT